MQQKVSYLYDAFDRLIGKRVDSDGDTGVDATEAYVYDGDQIVLQFGDDDDAALSDSDLTHRYLWGPAVDQLLADEAVTSLASAGTVSWALGDHQNTVRDVVQYDSGADTASVVDHNAYDSFGNKLSQTSPSHDLAFGYTGRIFDADTGLQWNGSADGGGRWYDAKTGRWLSEDSAGFDAGDPNLYRYAYNSSTIYVDPSGRFPVDDPAGQAWFAAHPIYWTNPNTGNTFIVPRLPYHAPGTIKPPSYSKGGEPPGYWWYVVPWHNRPTDSGWWTFWKGYRMDVVHCWWWMGCN
ncbi:MAG: RHS repeat-associated core domain-containing protein [Pirellulales bacterium]|nr:RHS repeat-associated core domain-containing protein [Pirellulales bacterium]